MSDAVKTISALQTQLIDAANGYEEAQELAKEAPVAKLCHELRDTHEKHAHELADILLQHGVEPDADGSFMSVVHKTVLNVRFAFTADETNLLSGLRDGEKRIISSYDDALQDAEAQGSNLSAHTGLLTRQRNTVLENIATIDSMEAAA